MTHHLLEVPGTEVAQVESYEMERVAVEGPSFLPARVEDLTWAANMLAESGVVPHLLGQPGRCMAVAYAAARHGMDPVAFAGQTYFTPVKGGVQGAERMSYMSQLVSAIITSSKVIKGRLRVRYEGTGQQRFCIVTGYIKGEVKPFIYTSPILGQIKPKHSPLWFTEPDQQLAYYSKRGWCRRHAEDILLGVYDLEEFQALETDEVVSKRDAFDESDLDAPEASASSGVVVAAGQETEDGHPNAPPKQQQGGKRQQPRQQQRPEPSGGHDAEVQEPDDMPDVREWALKEVDKIVELPQGLARSAWDALIAHESWGRLKAYNQAVAQHLKGRVARHLQGGGDSLAGS